jgi:hypothetical protein
VSGWFKGKQLKGPISSPPIYHSFVEFLQAVFPAATPLSTYLTIATTSLASPSSLVPSSLPERMGYQLADPALFMPKGFQTLKIHGRKMMTRACTRRAMQHHEDWVIVSIQPLLVNEVPFPNVRDVLHEFLIHHKRIRVRDIQKTHLGQAMVRFEHIYDRDNCIALSPHPYGDVTFSFVKHNEGKNWRRMEFNMDCWLMLLGFPLYF